jgi:hypothetical protein
VLSLTLNLWFNSHLIQGRATALIGIADQRE